MMQQLWSCFPDLLSFLQLKFAFQMQPLKLQQLPLGCSAGPGSALALVLATPPSLEPKLEFNRKKTPLPLTADHRDDLGFRTKAGRHYLARNLFNLQMIPFPFPSIIFTAPQRAQGPACPCGRWRAQPALPSKRLIHHC